MSQVKVGQVWADKQKGEEGRTVRVVEVDSRYAVAELVTARTHALTQPVGRRTRILLDQVPRRFRLVSGPEGDGDSKQASPGHYGTVRPESEAILAALAEDTDALSEITAGMLARELDELAVAADEVAEQCRWALRHGAHVTGEDATDGD